MKRRKKNIENKNIKKNSKRRDEKEMEIGWREGRDGGEMEEREGERKSRECQIGQWSSHHLLYRYTYTTN